MTPYINNNKSIPLKFKQTSNIFNSMINSHNKKSIHRECCSKEIDECFPKKSILSAFVGKRTLCSAEKQYLFSNFNPFAHCSSKRAVAVCRKPKTNPFCIHQQIRWTNQASLSKCSILMGVCHRPLVYHSLRSQQFNQATDDDEVCVCVCFTSSGWSVII